jgi:hypothetical protein
MSGHMLPDDVEGFHTLLKNMMLNDLVK